MQPTSASAAAAGGPGPAGPWPVAVAVAALAAGVYRLFSTVESFTPYLTALKSQSLAMSTFERVGAVFPLKWEDTLYCFLLSFAAWLLLIVVVAVLGAVTPMDDTAATATAASPVSTTSTKPQQPASPAPSASPASSPAASSSAASSASTSPVAASAKPAAKKDIPLLLRKKFKTTKASGGVTPRPYRTLPAILLHVAFLAFQAWMETFHKQQLYAQYLCTWSWWAAGAYAIACLATANNVNAPAFLPLTAVVFPASMGLILWTHVSYLRILPTYPVQNLLHIMPFIYYAAAIRIDDRFRPQLSMRTVAVASHVAGLIPMLSLFIYGQIFDYRDIYSSFFEMYGVSSWWPSLETTFMVTTAIVAGHVLYGYASGAVPSWRRRLVNLVVLVVAATAIPLGVLVVQPVRLHHMRNCPPDPVNLAYLDKATGALTVNATTAATLRETVLAPLYVHAIAGPSVEARVLADTYLDRMIISPVLEPLCQARTVPSAPGEIWLRSIPLPFSHPSFRSRVISHNYGVSRVGTIFILYTDGVDSAAAATATAALLALAPSAVYYVDRAPDAAELGVLGGLAHAAVQRQAACPAGRCVLSTVDAFDPHSGAPRPAGAATAPLGALTIAVKSAVDIAEPRPYDGYNMTAYLTARLDAGAGPGPSFPGLFTQLAMFELGHERMAPAELDALLAADAHFARWGPYPFLLQHFGGYVPPVESDAVVNSFLDTLATVLQAQAS